jgi:hypothetical protein
MGSEQLCTVRSAGKTSRGKALLETGEIIFRGDFRLQIPFASLLSTVAKGGQLHLTWNDGSAVFDLGERAAQWADQILHPKTTAEKLGIKPGMTISVQAIRDTAFLHDLREKAKTVSASKLMKDSDLIFLGAAEASDLADVAELVPSLASAGALWIVYPTGRQEITEAQVFSAGKAAGLVEVKVVKFSETHTALKFVRPKAKR